MTIVKLRGGLGNQMFQYAFGRALSLNRKRKVKENGRDELLLDTSVFGHENKKDTPRQYYLDAFNIQAKTATTETSKLVAKFNSPIRRFIRKVWKKIFPLNDYKFYKGLQNSESEFFEGFWQSEKYFADISDQIRTELTLKQSVLDKMPARLSQIMTELKNNTEGHRASVLTVSLHVRRGDYISNPHAKNLHETLDPEYYEKALSHISSKIGEKNIKIYVFSDEIEWVKNNLNLSKYSVEYVSDEDSNKNICEELYLMSLCDHNIIANSSYSWWGAWLNRNQQKLVIAPKKWVRNPTVDTSDVCPPEWTRI